MKEFNILNITVNVNLHRRVGIAQRATLNVHIIIHYRLTIGKEQNRHSIIGAGLDSAVAIIESAVIM
jgi:hypothetical protein